MSSAGETSWSEATAQKNQARAVRAALFEFLIAGCGINLYLRL
jgi:hypothetical protein